MEGYEMVDVLVLYYSRTGKTNALADAVAEGVKSVEGASAEVKRVDYGGSKFGGKSKCAGG